MSTFKWRQFEAEVILWGVRLHCQQGISYRDLEQMMGEHSHPWRDGNLVKYSFGDNAFFESRYQAGSSILPASTVLRQEFLSFVQCGSTSSDH
jgi:hypothetical protein